VIRKKKKETNSVPLRVQNSELGIQNALFFTLKNGLLHTRGAVATNNFATKSLELGLWVVDSVVSFISQKVFIKSFCKNRFPHKSVNSFFTLAIIKSKLTELCVN